MIKREAMVEIQPNANHLDPVLRHLNFTQYKLTCEYTRQINMSNCKCPLSSPIWPILNKILNELPISFYIINSRFHLKLRFLTRSILILSNYLIQFYTYCSFQCDRYGHNHCGGQDRTCNVWHRHGSVRYRLVQRQVKHPETNHTQRALVRW